MLVYGALCVALSFALSSIRIFRMPQGGSVTPASMLPLIAFALAYGPLPSAVVSLAYGLLHMFQDPWIATPVQAALDYPLAFMGIAACGLFSKAPPKWNYIAGAVCAGLWRYACHVLSGVAFFAAYAPDGQAPLLYSLGYNSFVLVEIVICIAVLAIPQVRRTLARITA
jgi:thiamine transporter